MLERSATQRRADALAAIFDRAAAADPAADGPDPIVNIVIDETTWLAHLARSLGDDDAELPDPATVPGGAAKPSTAPSSTPPTSSPPPSSATSAAWSSTPPG